MLLWLGWVLILSSPPLTAQPTGEPADFLIAERPDRLLIYNRFQQVIPEPERQKRFLPYQPLWIEQQDGYLSDGFTPCMKIRVGRDTYYIIKQTDGQPENPDQIGEYVILENCEALGDTVEILRSGKVFIAQTVQYRDITNVQKIYPDAPDRLVRIFRHRGHTFVQKPGASPVFGWSNITERQKDRLWRAVRSEQPPAAARQIDLPEIAARVERETDAFNETVRQLFAYFNQKTGQQKPVPRWQVRVNREEIQCTLENPLTAGEAGASPYAESTRYLLIRLENMLQGTGYSLNSTPRGFIIGKNQALRHGGGLQ